MRNSNLLISELYEKKKGFSYLRAIHVYWDTCEDEYSKLHVDMVLCDYPFDKSNSEFKIKFTDVKDLKLGRMNNICTLLLDIYDISSHQMEDINFRVTEEEENLFSFYCKSFAFEVIS